MQRQLDPSAAAGAVVASVDRATLPQAVDWAAAHLLVVGRHHALGAYESPAGHVRATLMDGCLCPVAVVPEVSTADVSG